jgi:protein-S-isoprenylcysteine O-methyltransferase Ste14
LIIISLVAYHSVQVQFVLVIAHSVGPLLTPGCTYSKALAVISTVYTVSVFGLFLNFYIVNYTKPASSTDDSKGQQAMKVGDWTVFRDIYIGHIASDLNISQQHTILVYFVCIRFFS